MNWRTLFRTKSIGKIHADIEAAEAAGHAGLTKNLDLRDLVAMAIAAIVGAGIFSTIGTACVNGGPAVVLLFLFTAVACVFSAMCYAEFASTVPISGSAYTYAYTTLGEVVAWMLGWNLLFEYAIGNITVAISWSDYFTNLMRGIGLNIPEWLTMDYLSASRAVAKIADLTATGHAADITDGLRSAAAAWATAPEIGGLKIIADLPALLITLLISMLIIRGIKESKNAANIMVVIKMVVVAAVILIGMFYVNPGNWSPFAPTGVGGVMMGVSSVFFAYIGFDAISTTAEECKNPQRDLPKAMIIALVVCTIVYVLLALVLTGMVSYKELGVGDPLAYVFGKVGLDWVEGVVAASAVVAMASVFLVFQIGQPRIWMAMSRDGLLPKKFSEIHPKYKTPVFSSILAGLLVAIPSLFLNLTEVTDLCAIGTLFAFATVSAGVLFLKNNKDRPSGGFRVPVLSGKFVVPLLFVGYLVLRYYLDTASWAIDSEKGMAMSEFLYHRIPVGIFIAIFGALSWVSFRFSLSLIPVLGVVTNLYLMSELSTQNWIRFGIWCIIGVAVYALYSYRNSKLATE